MESLLNKFICLQDCNFTRKRLHDRRFPVNIANFKDTYFEKHMRTAGFDSSYIMHRKSNKIIPEADCPSRLAFYFFQIIKSLCFSYSHSYYFVLSLVVIRCHSLSFFVTCCTTRWHSLYHSLLFVVALDVIRCHSFSFVVPLVVIHCQSLSSDVTRCTTRLSVYKR